MADLPLYADTEDEAIRRQLAAQYGALPAPPFDVEGPVVEVYNPDRPSTWDAPDSPKLTTLDRQQLKQDAYLASQQPRDLAAEVEQYDVEQTRAGISPYDIAGIAGMRGGEADAEADQIRQMLMQGVVDPGGPNPRRPIVERYHGAMMGTPEQPGLLAEQVDLTQQLGNARMDEQRAHAVAYAQEAGRQQAEIDAAEYRVAQQQAKREQIMHAQQLVMQKLTDAADRVNNAPEVDYDRYWKSQSAGRKFAWGLQAALAGFAGLNPTAALETAINMDVNEQKANFDQRRAGLDARTTEFNAQSSLLQDFRMATGDDEAAELMLRQLRWNQAEAGMKALAAKEGIAPAELEQNLFLNEMRQKQAEVAMALDTMIATTPHRIGGGIRPAVSGFQRDVLEGRLKQLDRRGERFDEMALDMGSKAALQGQQIQGDIEKENVKSAGRARVAQQKDTAKAAAQLAASVKAEQSVIGIVDDMLSLADKSGGGRPGKFGPLEAPELFSSAEQRKWELNKKALKLLVQRWASGATLTEQQTAMVDQILQDSAWTGGREVQALRDLKSLMQSVSKASERGYGEDVRQQYHRARDLPSVEASYAPDTDIDPVEVDED